MSANLQPVLEVAETRRFQRVPVSLFGRYMLESKREFPCQTVEMSPGDMLLYAPNRPALGENVVVYLDELGRFAGPCVRLTESGFALLMNLPPQKRDKLAERLTWFANRHCAGMPEDRRHDRVIPLMRRAMLRLPDDREIIVKILDISVSGVGVETDCQPPIGSRITVGSTPAVVVRHFDGGFACEFQKAFAEGAIDESTRLCRHA
jgi:hypothetical protein